MTVQGNWVGTDVGRHGRARQRAHTGSGSNTNQVTVGGLGAGEGNVVAFNRGAGVIVSYDTPQPSQNTIRGNSIYSNGLGDDCGLSTLGIDLGDPGSPGQGGPTPNDLGDGDEGPNGHLNFPLISSAVTNGPAGQSTTIQGTLDSTPNTEFDVDFYAVSACLRRPQGFREGQTYIGTATRDDGRERPRRRSTRSCRGSRSSRATPVTATATDAQGNTSEFSQRFVLSANPASGIPAGGTVTTLGGFNFLAGATVTIGGLPATNVTSQLQLHRRHHARPARRHRQRHHGDEHRRQPVDPSNGWVADFLDVPAARSSTSSSRRSCATRSPSAWAEATTASASPRCDSRWPCSS